VVNASGRSSLPVGADGGNRQLRLLADEGVAIRSGRIALARWRWDPQCD
jgi:alkylated DNA nucleotide flippase Atl1